MSIMKSFATVAFAGLLAAPLSAQVVVGSGTVRDRVEAARRRAEEARTRATIDSAILRGDRNSRRSSSSKIPPGQLPPRGMCRVWIDGVPPGHQPPVESCTEARVRAATTANARVIYGDDQAFPGKGRGKFKNRDRDDDDRFKNRNHGDDDRFENDDDRDGRSQLSKSERKAAKAARKANKGKGRGR